MKPNKSAAAHTIPIPGVNLREQRMEDPLPPGSTVRRRVFRTNDGLSTHLTFGVVPLCHAEGRMEEHKSIGTAICQACRVEAGRQRLAVK